LIFQPTKTGVKILHESAIELQHLQAALELARREFPTVSVGLYNVGHWYTERIDHGIKTEMEYSGETPEIVKFVTLLKQSDLKIYKLMFNCFDLQEMKELVSKLHELNLGVNIKLSTDNCLEITAASAQKSRGIEFIKELESLDKSEMAAFGDGFNDVSMLEEVGVPIVMENALEGVKKYGRHLTKDNDHDGVAYGITEFLQED